MKLAYENLCHELASCRCDKDFFSIKENNEVIFLVSDFWLFKVCSFGLVATGEWLY